LSIYRDEKQRTFHQDFPRHPSSTVATVSASVSVSSISSSPSSNQTFSQNHSQDKSKVFQFHLTHTITAQICLKLSLSSSLPTLVD
jgi:hypothetical protein